MYDLAMAGTEPSYVTWHLSWINDGDRPSGQKLVAGFIIFYI
ncbi:hypothetical protein GXY_09529 [Novacetimonas hansenii ATCC 23769]|uniref:Uncharacterized protein n=1 Tax=Novacetimonas hansenii ATCC 23769 TaxID=714995 RepID=D5QFI6_NOVHA|nr:hypothetical protein GXY_09529 [Novacetimonas hansenii ATCC 23769]